MPRHRSDPRGTARIVLATGAVLLMLALLSAGGYALYSALNSSKPADANSDPSGPPSHTATGHAKTHAQALSITVTGAQCHIFVKGPGQTILVDRTFQRGDTFHADDAPLDVVLSDPAAAQVTVYGKRKAAAAQFTVTDDGSAT